jgi:Protein of unknown function (DUF3276)
LSVLVTQRFKTKTTTVGYDNNDKRMDSVYSKRIRAGKRRTYFFDVRTTRGNDYYLTITESRKRFNDDGYDRHKIFLYKEDFNKFLKALTEAVDHVKTELMPDFDFDAFNHEHDGEGEGYEPDTDNGGHVAQRTEEVKVEAPAPLVVPAPAPVASDENDSASEEVDKW